MPSTLGRTSNSDMQANPISRAFAPLLCSQSPRHRTVKRRKRRAPITGFIYGANIGWIHLGNGRPANGIQYENKSAADYGVNHDRLGNLRGLAYGANIGWVSFETNGAPRIDLANGRPSGFVYGANIGWINLSDANYFLQIDSIASGLDADNDSIPDSWEFTHAGNLTALSGESDRDHDGSTDAQEYLADTNPLDANDSLSILQFSANANLETAMLTWMTKATRQYVVQERLQFGPDASWANSILAPMTGNGGAVSVAVTNSPLASQKFFRLKAIRPLER